MRLPKAFVFGIDGGDWNIIEPLMAEGQMPHLAALRQDSARARLTCTRPAHTAPGWASLLSGNYPGKHGVYQFFHTQDPAYRARLTTSADFGVGNIFEWMGAQGWTCGAINVPMTHPPRPWPGYQITWPLANTLRFCDPPALLGELARGGAHFQSDLACMYRGDLAYIADALANIEHRVRTVEYLLENHPVDVVMVVLTEVDRVCHHYWHFSDPTHPAYDPSAAAAHRSAIVDCYRAVDTAFGRLRALMPDDATTVVVSDHGSGLGLYDLSVHRVLEEAGLLSTTESPSRGPEASWFHEEGRSIDWGRTRAYVPVPGSFGINVNLRGRQRDGTVAKDDLERIAREVEASLQDVELPGTRRGLVLRVLRAEEAYSGPFQEKAPDLLVVPEDERVILSCHLGGPLFRSSYQTGLHRYHGMWMHASPRVAAGELARTMRIVDVAPTLLADLGISWPAFIDGKPCPEVFQGARPCALPTAPAPLELPESDDEDPLVTERLRAMGYL